MADEIGGEFAPEVLGGIDAPACGGHAGKVSQTAAEAKDDLRAERHFVINMRRHATRADQQGRQGLHQTPEGLCAGQWYNTSSFIEADKNKDREVSAETAAAETYYMMRINKI